jgi:outer membrane protein OmpA-like peptidoglycan-associated protein
MKRGLAFLLSTAIVLVLLPSQSEAQSTMGRWALGIHGGLNYYIADYNTLKIGPGGEVAIRYGINRYFSLGLLAGYEVLKTEQTPPSPNGFLGYMRLSSIPVALAAYWHLAPRRKVNPYLFGTFGALMYQRGPGTTYPLDSQSRTSFLLGAGGGIETFVDKSASIDVSLGFTSVGDWIDAHKTGNINGYLNLKAGANFYFGASDADDDDHDGLTNGEERRYGTNPNVADTDGDGLGDGEEVKRYRTNPLRPDTDGDGIPDGEEVHTYHTNPTKIDSDGDGLSDGDEVFKYKTDPLRMDTDSDGLPDGDEVTKYNTDPLRVDSDSDGLSDWDEVKVYRTDPTNPDTDGDGLTDGDEVKKYKTDPLKRDSDGGGVDDGTEVRRGTNPLDPRDDMPVRSEKAKTSGGMEGITFENGSATISREMEPALERTYLALVSNPDLRITINGYADKGEGNERSNERLSQRRADAVSAWFVKKGIDATRMLSMGNGSRNPVSASTSPEGRAKNRRVDFSKR